MSLSVMMIEDDADIQQWLKMFLESEGYEVFSASNGREALNFLDAGNSPNPILLDLMMPVMNGYEFLSAFKENPNYSKIPIVLFSASTDLENTANAEHRRFVKKPIDLDHFLKTVRESLPKS